MNVIRKYRPGVLAVALVLAAIWGLNTFLREDVTPLAPSEIELREAPGLTMTVDEVQGTRFFMTFYNESNVEYGTGWGCSMEKQVDGVWYSLKNHEEGDLAFTAELYILTPGESREWEERVDYYGSPLSPGRYRIIKGVIGPGEPGDPARFFDAVAEFEID